MSRELTDQLRSAVVWQLSESPRAPHDIERRACIASLNPFDDEVLALVEGRGAHVTREVLDAQPRRVRREPSDDSVDKRGPEPTPLMVRIKVELVEHVIRPVPPALRYADEVTRGFCNDYQTTGYSRLDLRLVPPVHDLPIRGVVSNQRRIVPPHMGISELTYPHHVRRNSIPYCPSVIDAAASVA